MEKIIFDTYAWIEYFNGSEKGMKVEQYFSKEVFTPNVVLLELSCKLAKQNIKLQKYLDFIKINSRILQLNENIIKETGKTYVEIRKKAKDFSMIDSVILTSARIIGAKVITGDKHFEGLKEAIML